MLKVDFTFASLIAMHKIARRAKFRGFAINAEAVKEYGTVIIVLKSILERNPCSL